VLHLPGVSDVTCSEKHLLLTCGVTEQAHLCANDELDEAGLVKKCQEGGFCWMSHWKTNLLHSPILERLCPSYPGGLDRRALLQVMVAVTAITAGYLYPDGDLVATELHSRSVSPGN